MLSRIYFSVSFFAFASLSAAVEAAPTDKETKWVEAIFDYNAADDLANLTVCEKPELYGHYLQSLLGAGMAHPRTDPNKIAALVRQIQRKATSLADMRKGFNERTPPTPEEFESGCRFDVGQAVKHLEDLDDYIFKS